MTTPIIPMSEAMAVLGLNDSGVQVDDGPGLDPVEGSEREGYVKVLGAVVKPMLDDHTSGREPNERLLRIARGVREILEHGLPVLDQVEGEEKRQLLDELRALEKQLADYRVKRMKPNEQLLTRVKEIWGILEEGLHPRKTSRTKIPGGGYLVF